MWPMPGAVHGALSGVIRDNESTCGWAHECNMVVRYNDFTTPMKDDKAIVYSAAMLDCRFM